MDLGKYIKKSNANTANTFNRPKRCLQCNREIDRERAGHLYFQSFCSRICKERYIGHPLEE